jgi:hypothetical protein
MEIINASHSNTIILQHPIGAYLGLSMTCVSTSKRCMSRLRIGASCSIGSGVIDGVCGLVLWRLELWVP